MVPMMTGHFGPVANSGEAPLDQPQATVQLTGNVAGTRTTRHVNTRETREGAGKLQGIVSKTKIT